MVQTFDCFDRKFNKALSILRSPVGKVRTRTRGFGRRAWLRLPLVGASVELLDEVVQIFSPRVEVLN